MAAGRRGLLSQLRLWLICAGVAYAVADKNKFVALNALFERPIRLVVADLSGQNFSNLESEACSEGFTSVDSTIENTP